MPRKALKRRADGRYACRYKDQWFYGTTSDEALSARDEYKMQIKSGMKEDSLGITVERYAAKWISVYKSDVSKATYNTYAYYLNILCDKYGAIRMRDITATDIKELYNSQKGNGAWRIRKFCILIRSLFRSAQEDGIIQRNPSVSIKLPKGDEGTHRALEPWECTLVESMVGKHKFAVAAMLMLYAGLRRGEAIALNVDTDVDFDNGVIHVTKAIAFDVNQPHLKRPKSEAGIRDIPLFDPLRNALKSCAGLVVSKKDGDIVSDSSFRSTWNSYISALETELNGCHKRWYGKTKEHKLLIASGAPLPPWKSITIRAHDFRHTFCTMLYDASVDIKTAMRWMGHADEKMIIRIYAHLSEEKEKKAALSVSNLISERLCSQNGSQTK